MRHVTVMAMLVAAFALAVPLMAQGYGKGGKKPSKEDIEKWRKGKGGGESGNWLKERIDELGWGEDGTEERVEPGDTVDKDVKETRLEEEAAKLGITDEDRVEDLVKYGKRAWDKCEREDAKWGVTRKKVKSNAEKLAKETDEHKEELAEIWADCDEDLVKKEVLTEEQVAEFAKNTKDLREETATDKSVRQDEIRERKVEELKKQAEDYVKGGMGGSDEENEVKKEKKDDDTEEDKD